MQKTIVAKKTETKQLTDIIVNSILDKKGEETVLLDLTNLDDAVTDYFIICHATSTTQVKAIYENIIKKTKELAGQTPWGKEGIENLEWVLLDYVDVVVHIFLQERREFYQLEDLWSDAPLKRFE